MTKHLCLIAALVTLNAYADPTAPKPPVAPEVPHELKMLDDVRQDPYFWLRDKTKPETLAYLKAENDYADSVMKTFSTPVTKLVEEMKSHVKEDDRELSVSRG